MSALITVGFYLGLVAYSVAATLFFLELTRRDLPGPRRSWAPQVLMGAAVFHAIHIVASSLLTRVCPVESLHFALSLSGLVTVGAYLLVHRRSRLYSMGVFVAPLALAFLIAAQFVGQPASENVPLSHTLLLLHIASNVLGVGLFLLSGAAEALYLVQDRRLREKRIGQSSRLPPLDALDRVAHRFLLMGFPLLTFGVVTGAFFSEGFAAPGGAALLRSLLGYATWLLLGGVLLMRRLWGVAGRRAAYGTLAGVLCVLLVLLIYAIHPTGMSS